MNFGYNSNMKIESWRSIKEFEGLYEVSDWGRVRSLQRITASGLRGGKILGARLSGKAQRPKVGLSKDGVVTEREVHSLVLEAFIGPRPPGHEACHNDGNRLNNVLANLRWDSRAANHADSVRHGTAKYPNGEENGRAKLTIQDVAEIRRRRLAGEECLPIAQDFGITRQHVGVIARGAEWRHV